MIINIETIYEQAPLPEIYETNHITFNPFQFCPEQFDKVWILDSYDVPTKELFDPSYRQSKSLYSLFKIFKTEEHIIYCREEELKLRRRLQSELYSKSDQMELFPERILQLKHGINYGNIY